MTALAATSTEWLGNCEITVSFTRWSRSYNESLPV